MTSTVRWRRSSRGAALAVAAVIVVGCATDDPPGRLPPAPGTAATTATALSPLLTHLHGLHVSADRTLLAGTHTGLVAINPTGTTTLSGPPMMT